MEQGTLQVVAEGIVRIPADDFAGGDVIDAIIIRDRMATTGRIRSWPCNHFGEFLSDRVAGPGEGETRLDLGSPLANATALRLSAAAAWSAKGQ
jgi:hypothetical protein